VLEQEAEAFDCETCPIACAQAALSAENAEAWRIFNLCGSRVAVQWNLSHLILQRMTERWTVDETTDVIERLDIILAELAPPRATDG
jgi:hypothetical protein